MAREHAISHVVGSLYDFSETAGRDIISSFRKTSESDISCHFDAANVFTIHTSHFDDKSLSHLVKSIAICISVEKNQQPELFEYEKITRISGTHPSLTLAASTEERMQANKPISAIPLIEHENIIRRWSPSGERNEVGSKLSVQLLGMIGDLCGCRIEHVGNSADLFLKADREQDTHKGISKLEHVNKMMVDEMSFPLIHSFCILEGQTSVSLQLIALKDVNDKRLATTLIRKGLVVNPLRDLCVLVLVKGSNVIQVNLKPATSTQGCRLWNDHVHSYNQAQDPSAAKTMKEPKTLVYKWVSEATDTDVQMDAFRPESAVEVQQPVNVGTVSKEPLSPTKKPIIKRARAARGCPDAHNKAFTESSHGHDSKEATSQENHANFDSHQTTETLSTGNESESHRQPPRIEPPYMPPLATPLRSLSKAPSRTSQNFRPCSSTWNIVARDSTSGNLVDMSVPNEKYAVGETTAVLDKVQHTAKAKARELRYTMNQRKAATQALVGGDTALVKSFEETMTHLLVLALPRTRIGFAVDVGRLLINQQYGSSEFRNKIFKTSEFSSVLPKGRTTGFEPIFTDMLTGRSSEAESIVNILLSQGRRLFQQDPASRKVTYVFSCKAKGGDGIVLETDQNGELINMRGSEILIGALDWHFPKRAWDARLRLTCEKFVATDYSRQVKGIIDNLKSAVSADGLCVELSTNAIDDSLSIESITLCRETLHPVMMYPDLILHLTEYQDLQVHQPSKSEGIYSGSVQPSSAMIKAKRLWWGAKISSIGASTILEENTSLELGETATWTPSSIINKGVVRDLFAAAKEIVTRIDHVGFFNRGEGSSSSKTAEKPSENTQVTSARLRRVDPGYW